MHRLGTLPLVHQPGERWLYHTGAEVLGVLIARASGQPLDAFLRERILEPLEMRDTGFVVPANVLDRFGPCYWTDPTTGTNALYDAPQGQWSSPPAFPSGGARLACTLDVYFALAQMLRAGGIYRGKRILSRPSVEPRPVARGVMSIRSEAVRSGGEGRHGAGRSA